MQWHCCFFVFFKMAIYLMGVVYDLFVQTQLWPAMGKHNTYHWAMKYLHHIALIIIISHQPTSIHGVGRHNQSQMCTTIHLVCLLCVYSTIYCLFICLLKGQSVCSTADICEQAK